MQWGSWCKLTPTIPLWPRRIVVAQYAHVTYNEYLTVLMGRPVLEKHTLLPGAEGPGSGFIPEVNPGVLASFALSSYRNTAVSMHDCEEFNLFLVFSNTNSLKLKKILVYLKIYLIFYIEKASIHEG